MKKFLIVFFIFFFFLISSKKVEAVIMWDGQYPSCDEGACSSSSKPDDCYNGPSTTNSGGCGTACGGGDVWSHYGAECRDVSDPDDPQKDCEYVWVRMSNVCSTGDKCKSGDGGLIRAGSCDCGEQGIYKTCCDGSTMISCTGYDADGQDPPESNCSGRTERCGGAGEPNCGSEACDQVGPTNTPGGPTNTPVGYCSDAGAGFGCLNQCPAGCEHASGYDQYCTDSFLPYCCKCSPDACQGTCRKSNPFDPDPPNEWYGEGGISQCSHVELPEHYDYWPGGNSTAAGNAGDLNCQELNGCSSGEFNCKDVCCGSLWPAPTSTPTPIPPTSTPTPIPPTSTPTPTPIPPGCSLSNFQCGDLGTTNINLLWKINSYHDVDGIAVQRGGSVVWTSSSGIFLTTYNDTGLTPDTTYNYRVGCYKSFGSGTGYYDWTGSIPCSTNPLPTSIPTPTIPPGLNCQFVQPSSGSEVSADSIVYLTIQLDNAQSEVDFTSSATAGSVVPSSGYTGSGCADGACSFYPDWSTPAGNFPGVQLDFWAKERAGLGRETRCVAKYHVVPEPTPTPTSTPTGVPPTNTPTPTPTNTPVPGQPADCTGIAGLDEVCANASGPFPYTIQATGDTLISYNWDGLNLGSWLSGNGAQSRNLGSIPNAVGLNIQISATVSNAWGSDSCPVKLVKIKDCTDPGGPTDPPVPTTTTIPTVTLQPTNTPPPGITEVPTPTHPPANVIEGHVFFDYNNNGFKDYGEPGICADVRFTAYDSSWGGPWVKKYSYSTNNNRYSPQGYYVMNSTQLDPGDPKPEVQRRIKVEIFKNSWTSECSPWPPASQWRPNYTKVENITYTKWTRQSRQASFPFQVERDCEASNWFNVGCGPSGGCDCNQMHQRRYWYWSDTGTICETNNRCVNSAACICYVTPTPTTPVIPVCEASSWLNVGCGLGGCSSTKMLQYRYWYWSDGSGLCATNGRCRNDPACIPVATNTPTNMPIPTNTSTPTNTPTPTATPTPQGIMRGTAWDDEDRNAICNGGEPSFGGLRIHWQGEFGSSGYDDTTIEPNCNRINYSFNVPADRWITVYYNTGDLPGDYEATTPSWVDHWLSGGETFRYNFGVADIRPLWFQILGGGVQLGPGPTVDLSTGNYLIADGSYGSAGALITGDGSLPDLGDGSLSDSNWQITSGIYSNLIYNLDFFATRLIGLSGPELTDTASTSLYDSVNSIAGFNCNAIQCTLGGGLTRIIRYGGGNDFILDREMVVPIGSFFAILNNGNLIVPGAVDRLDGIYLTEKGFQVENGDNQLVVNGIVSANVDLSGGQGIRLERDLEAGNRTTPGVEFNYRPDLIINMPACLWKSRFKMEELAP